MFSNRAVGLHAELLVSAEIAADMLAATALAALPLANAQWERELVRWLIDAKAAGAIDVSDIAWTPEHFEAQRRFVIEAIARAATSSPYASALDRWRRLVEVHPRQAVQVGRRWLKYSTKYSDLQQELAGSAARARTRV